jgi:hypothetical protein
MLSRRGLYLPFGVGYKDVFALHRATLHIPKSSSEFIFEGVAANESTETL